ncbi:MAG TPA: SGNH hydrolase domain-containing protein, partial [Casimicrobiaceae bacterium]|nr:SGNH hydrolase domain-containing protein [Casimicrobiaceae bacterium]
LSFMRIVEGSSVSATSVATALLLSFALAIATFLWIERPLRSRRGRLGIISLTGVMAIVGLAGLFGANQWLKPRLYGQGLDAFSEAATDWQYPSPGFVRRRTADGIDVWTAGPGPRQVLIWGDSNAEQYGPRVQRLLDNGSLAASQTEVVFATRGSCPPIRRAHIEEDEGCNAFAEKAFALANTAGISTVVLIAQWTGYFSAPTLRVQHPNGSELRGAAAAPAALDGLADVIRALRGSGKRVVLVLNIPVAPELAPRSILQRRWSGSVAAHGDGLSRQTWNAIRDRLSSGLTSAARQAGATLVDPADFLCDSLRCPALERNGVPRYHDGYHLRASFVRDRVGYLDSIILGAPR